MLDKIWHPQKILGIFILLLLAAFEVSLNYFPSSPGRAALALVLFFIPGLVLARALLGSEADNRETLCLALTLPPVLYILLLYLLTYYFHRPFWPSLHLLLWAICLPAAVRLFLQKQNLLNLKEGISFESLFILFAGIMVLLALIPQVYPQVQMGPQETYYASISYMVENNFSPPRNPALYGASTATYWLYFFYLAGISSLTGFSPPQASIFSNIFCLLVFLLTFYSLARYFYRQRLAVWAAVLIALGGVNLWGYLFFLGRIINPAAADKTAALTPTGWSHFQFENLLPPSVHYIPQMGLYHKFLFYTGFPMGFIYLGLMLWAALLLLKGMKKKAFIFSLIGALGALQFHTYTVFFQIAFIMTALGILWFYRRLKGNPFSPWWGLYLLLPFIISVLIHFPYLKEIGAAHPQKLIFFHFKAQDFLMQFMLLCPILPLFILGARNLLKKNQLPELFFLLYALVTLAGAIFILLYGMNNYKFTYLSALAMGLVAGSFFENLKKISWGRVILGLILFSLFFNVILMDAGFAQYYRKYPSEKFYHAHGEVLFKDNQDPRAAAYGWIKQHTEKTAVFFQYPMPQNPEFLTLPMVAHRGVYVSYYIVFTQGLKGFDEKIKQMLVLFTPGVKGKEAVLQSLAQVPDPLYIFLEKDLPSFTGEFEQLSGEFESSHASRLKKVYENEEVKIYRLQKAVN